MTEQQTKRMVIKLGVDEQVDFYLGALPVFLPGMEGIVDDMTGKSSQLIDMVDLAIQTADQHIEGHQSEGLTHNKPVFMGANGPYYIDLKTIEAVDAQQSLPYRTIIPRGEVGKQDVGEFLKGDPNKPIFKDDDGNYYTINLAALPDSLKTPGFPMVTITGPNGETFETPAWTVHCRFGSKGAYFHPGLGLDQELFRPMSEQDMVIHREIDERGAVVATQKAHGYESYGDFFTVFGTITPAGEYMRQLILSAADQGITDLDYVTSGLATNYCVEATVVQLYELLEQIRNANPELTLPNINVHLANDLTEAIPDPEMDMDVEKTRIASIGRMAEKAQEYADKGLNVTFESKPFEELSADIEKWKEARSTDPSIATAIDTVLQTSRGYSMDRRTEAAANFTASKEGIKAVNKQSFLGNTIETLAQLTSQTVDAVQDKLMGSRS